MQSETASPAIENDQHAAQSQQSEELIDTTTLYLYRRGAFGKKHFYTPPASEEVKYFIRNPVPQKHNDTWKPVLHRGDNPKYIDTSLPVARARRTAMWTSFRIELGDGVHEVLENARRVKEKKSHERKKKWRKAFRMGDGKSGKALEEEQPVRGFVMALTMRRMGFLSRRLEFDWAGRTYIWTGTRVFLPSWSQRMKGVSHGYKLMDSQGDLIATFDKNRWVSYTPSQKPGTAFNKNMSHVGTLAIFPGATRTSTLDIRRHNSAGMQSKVDALDHKLSGNKGNGDENVNLEGEHSGDLTEEVVVFTAWMVVEGEHRLRYKIFDFLEEIAENVGGG